MPFSPSTKTGPPTFCASRPGAVASFPSESCTQVSSIVCAWKSPKRPLTFSVSAFALWTTAHPSISPSVSTCERSSLPIGISSKTTTFTTGWHSSKHFAAEGFIRATCEPCQKRAWYGAGQKRMGIPCRPHSFGELSLFAGTQRDCFMRKRVKRSFIWLATCGERFMAICRNTLMELRVGPKMAAIWDCKWFEDGKPGSRSGRQGLQIGLAPMATCCRSLLLSYCRKVTSPHRVGPVLCFGEDARWSRTSIHPGSATAFERTFSAKRDKKGRLHFVLLPNPHYAIPTLRRFTLASHLR